MKLIGQLQIAENEKHTADSPKKTYCGSQAGQRSLPAGYTQFQKNCHMAAEPDGTAENTAGKDPEGKVKKFLEELKEQKIQKLNLLGLSKAHMVTIEDLNKNNYIYGAYDSFVTDRARGVHNFSPVRDKNGKLLGYSYHDTSTPEILYDDYNDNDEIENIVKFTGLNIRECLADEKAHQDFKKGKINSDKIYSMKKILSQNEIEAGKLDYLGEYISADKKLVFDTNSRDEVLFQKTNCEGSERPSVVSMWGSCFATLNKIKEDIFKTLGYNNK